MRTFIQVTGVVFLLLVISFLSVSYVCADSTTAYTRYNTHVKEKVHNDGSKVYSASIDNYIVLGEDSLFLPAGTKIELLGKRRYRLWFRVESDNLTVMVNYSEPKMHMKVRKYIDLITSPQPVSFDGFSDVDIEGINTGTVSVGMSRDGVLAAYGYPAVYLTPSLASSTWFYSAGHIKVNFGEDGMVESVE